MVFAAALKQECWSDNHTTMADTSPCSEVSMGPTVEVQGDNRKNSQHYRTQLPAEQTTEDNFSMWSVLKGGIGKELTRIPMPVALNEPLSFLQRVAEFMEYSELLQKAILQKDSILRMKYVAAFAVSGLASNWQRVFKPFNPLLGETYELQRADFRMVCEQVSHHPPVSAFHADSDEFRFHGSVQPKLKFWGRSIEISPRGTLTVELTGHKEVYTWSNVNSYVHNVMVGKLWVEQHGTMEITNHSTGDTCCLVFKPASGSSSKNLHRVDGHIYDATKAKRSFLYGKWTSCLRCTDMETYETFLAENDGKLSAEPSKKCTLSPIHGPKKMFSRLNSITTTSFRAQSDRELTVEMAEQPEEPPREGRLSRGGSDHSLDIPNSGTLWEAAPRPKDAHKYYHFTAFAMSLNELLDDMKLPGTDARLRPDIRALELGDTDVAATEKDRLEQKQRQTSKSRSKRKQETEPRYFQLSTCPVTKIKDWVYMGNYPDEKLSVCQDIF